MQIGVPTDQGLPVLIKQSEGSDLIMTHEVAMLVRGQVDTPKANVRAGLAYLFTRMALYEVRSVPSRTDLRVHSYTIRPGDSFALIAKRNGTTIEEIEQRNPRLDPRRLQPGQKVEYRKAARDRVITGWRSFNATTIATRYNGGGDPAYATKLDYVMTKVLPKLERRQ